jgi:hypothetical protein
MELYSVYEENIRMRDMLKEQERDRHLVKECEAELTRLKALLREVTEKRDSMPSEREEIKDRIIMKLEDELICTRIELKEANLQLHKLTRMQ